MKTRVGRRASVSSSRASRPDSMTSPSPPTRRCSPTTSRRAPTVRLARRPTHRAQQGAQPREHLVDVEGLDDVVLRAGVETLDAVGDRAPRGEEEDGRRQPPRAQPRHEVDALDARQPTVDDEHVPVVDEATVEARLAVTNGRDGIPLLAEQAR